MKDTSFQIGDRKAALECGFPVVEISQVAEQESWRKEINRPIYHIHKWWATRLGSVFRAITLGALSKPGVDIWSEFYKIHNLSNKVVLDPFMGSGTTLGEALKLGAKAIGSDINPVSTFLVRQAFTHVSESKLREVFEKLEKSIAVEIKKYYVTREPTTGEFIPVLYFFWTKIVETPEGEEVPLMSKYVFSQDAYPKKKPRAQIVCPGCWSIFEGRYDTNEVACPHCKFFFNAQKGPASGQIVRDSQGREYKIKSLLPTNGEPFKQRLYASLALKEDGKKVYLSISDEDKLLFSSASERLANEDLPLPTSVVRPGHNTDQARGYNYLTWRSFFNDRQLLCLGLLLKEILLIEDAQVQEQILCLFSSTLEFNNLFCSFKGEGTGAVRHMFSNHILKPERTPLENSIWGSNKGSGTFSSLFESRLLRAKRYLDDPFEVSLTLNKDGVRAGSVKTTASLPIRPKLVETWEELASAETALMVLNGNSAKLPIPDSSVDAVITDPPYFDFVHYSELSDFFFAWLSPALKARYKWLSRLDSSDPGEVQQKDPRVFGRQLSLVFMECARVLKDDGLLAFSFHHSRPEGWAAIYEAITSSGLVVVNAHAVHAELRGSSPKSAAKDPISLDAILVCRKRNSISTTARMVNNIASGIMAEAENLENAGMKISLGDKFVIGAALVLIEKSVDQLSFDDISTELKNMQDSLRDQPNLVIGQVGISL
jgi:putative DNA methylase